VVTTIDERVAELVEPLARAASLTLYDVLHTGSTLRVLVDGPQGVTLDQLAELTRTISVALDLDDPISGSYTLEVSSPGLERPLRRPDHFAGAVGARVTLRTRSDEQGHRRCRGILLTVDERSITVDDMEAGPVTVDIGEVESARTVFEWGPAPRPGHDKAAAKRSTKGPNG
jgi:ribosome maturation factor RimP